MIRCVAIFGPTASGKSGLALRLAERYNGVIVSADSMQIYRGMNVGTAKPTLEELNAVPHRMIDICDIDSPFSVYDYKGMAKTEIENVSKNGQLPFLTGGTGLYFDALFHNTDFGEMEIDPDVRMQLEKRAESEGSHVLLSELQTIDPKTAHPLHERDTKRIIRGLEVYYSTGKTLSEFKEKSHLDSGDISFLKLSLVYENRDVLYQRINQRVDQMLRDGLLEEAKTLYGDGVFSQPTSAQAIGYKELLPYLSGESSLDDCVDRLKQKTRNYAKRQITWFRRYEDVHHIYMDQDSDPFTTCCSLIEEWIKDEKNEGKKITD